MFIGHFAVGLVAKSAAPRVSLGTLVLAAQFIDLLWPTLLLMGVERVRIVPGATAVTPLVFEHYPVSHSLLAVLGWALLVGGAHFAARRDRVAAAVLGALVLSHWALDALTHQPDLPLLPGGTTLVGLNLWSSMTLTLVVEGSLFAFAVWHYARATTPSDGVGRWGYLGLAALLAMIHLANLAGPPPPSVEAIAWAGQLQWLLVAGAWWVDRHRRFGAAGWR